MIGVLSGDYVVNRLLLILPELETITLYPVVAGGGYGAGVAWTAQRRPATEADLWVAQIEGTDKGIKFVLLDVAGGSAVPDNNYKIVDALSVAWTVRSVDSDMFRRIHHVTCEKML